jgi:hypothetical protein
MMENDFRQNLEALVQLRQLEQMYDESLMQGYGENPEVDIDELMQAMHEMKKDIPKKH